MKYVSTRGDNQDKSFQDILLEGLAKDGGLYMPDHWPQISEEELRSYRGLSFAQLSAKVLAKFAPDIPEATLEELTNKAYSASVFCNVREGEDASKIFPVRALSDDLYLLQLSNGPTLAFKDAALQLLGHLLDWALKERNETLTILGATSGDTGSAAIHALRGKERIKVVMLSPAGRMSAFQRAQMYSVLDKNIMNIAIEGTFDDCQDLVKLCNADEPFKKTYHLGAVNSINWARVVAQTAYYVSAYLQVSKDEKTPVSFSVPSGNFGNALAGIVAKLMGVPIARLIVATNENDVLHQCLTTGCYKPAKVAQATSSPSMDITKASNFERAVFEAAGHDGALLAEMWEKLAKEGQINFAKDYPSVWQGIKALELTSHSSTHAQRLEMIKKFYDAHKLFIDPHTADGLHAASLLQGKGEPLICLETAQAAKFSETLEEALGLEAPVPAGFEDLLDQPQRVTNMRKDADLLKAAIKDFV